MRNYYVPKKLFEDEKYINGLNLSDKVIYAVIEEAWRVNPRNDEKGRYVEISRVSISEKLGLGEKAINRAIKRLVGVGLIEDIRQGMGMTNKIYLLDYTPL